MVVVGIVLSLVSLVVTLWRSTIPVELDGRVEDIEFLSEDNPGIDDIYVLTIDGEDIHVDRAVATQLTPNVYVSKEAWSTELIVGRFDAERTIHLSPSEDFTGLALTMPIVALVLGILLYGRRARAARPMT